MSDIKRFIYAGEDECREIATLVRQPDGDRIALVAIYLKSLCHAVPNEGIVQKSIRQLCKYVLCDEAEFASMLDRLSGAGIHYD